MPCNVVDSLVILPLIAVICGSYLLPTSVVIVVCKLGIVVLLIVSILVCNLWSSVSRVCVSVLKSYLTSVIVWLIVWISFA